MKKVVLLVLALLCVITSCKVEDSSSSVVPPVEFPDEILGCYSHGGGSLIINKNSISIRCFDLYNGQSYKNSSDNDVKEYLHIDSSVSTLKKCSKVDNLINCTLHITGIGNFYFEHNSLGMSNFEGDITLRLLNVKNNKEVTIETYIININKIYGLIDYSDKTDLTTKLNWNRDSVKCNKIILDKGMFVYSSNNMSIEKIKNLATKYDLTIDDIFEYEKFIIVLTSETPVDNYTPFIIKSFNNTELRYGRVKYKPVNLDKNGKIENLHYHLYN